MRLKKSIISILLVIAGLMALASCGSSSDSTPAPTGTVNIQAKSNQ